MGTNHYARVNVCHCCNRYDEVHVGKSWSMFHGFRRDPAWPDDPDPQPFGVIESWQDWKRVLLKTPGLYLFDEYGKETNPVTYVAEVESTSPDDRGRQYRWLVDHGHTLDHDWTDAEGFDFHDGEFS